MASVENKMIVEIWSDIMCPFCYIGKRKFETALSQFQYNDKIHIVWKSYQLSPDLKTDTSKNLHQFLAEHKGLSIERAKEMNDHVTQMAKENGLKYDFDKAIAANSFDAHRFSHLALTHNLQNEAEEKLFEAYFTLGKDISNHEILIQLGVEIGLEANDVKIMLESGQYTDAVKNDILEAQQIGVRGVPFFALNRKYAISGAQDSSIILDAIKTSFDEWQKENPESLLKVIDGDTCTPDGDCS